MKSLTSVEAAVWKNVCAVFFDIDDTFSLHGRIGADAYQALWDLHNAGIATIPVTGRPAGWCDFIARMWPVTAVVGENGAFFNKMTKHALQRVYLEDQATRDNNAKQLREMAQVIQSKFPQAKFASDQAFREFDLAVDYCEDVPRWSHQEVDALMELCRKQGAQVKLSSIHVNTWFGKYDKWTCVEKVFREVLSLDPDHDRTKAVYLGDSPNDEPFFEKLPLSVGVANVKPFLDRMKNAPQFITQGEGGVGFAEFVNIFLGAR